MSAESTAKRAERTRLLTEREGLTPATCRAKSDEICRQLAPWILTKRFTQVFLFASHRQEPDLSALLPLLPSDVVIAMPVITGKGTMRFYVYQASDALFPNRHGILEPMPKQEAQPTATTLILVPSVACDRQGFRLGYGGGFYDRFLSAHSKVLSIGVVFDQFLVNTLPSEAHDHRIHGVVTEKAIHEWRGIT